MNCLLSFIIAVKENNIALIKTLSSLDAIEKQNSRFEVIIINGGLSLVSDEITNLSYPLTIITECDDGIYDAWNKGLGLAQGEFVAFLGAGDCVRPNYFKEMADLSFKNGESDLLLCRQQQWLNNGRALREFGKPWDWERFKKNFNIPHIGCWHRRKLFDTFGNFDIKYKVTGDYEWLLRVGAQLKVSYTSLVLLDVPVGGISDSSDQVFKETRTARATHTEASALDLIYHDVRYRFRKFVRKFLWG